MEHGEGAAGQRTVLRQGEPGPRLQILHVPHAHHEAGRAQPDHSESKHEPTPLECLRSHLNFFKTLFHMLLWKHAYNFSVLNDKLLLAYMNEGY